MKIDAEDAMEIFTIIMFTMCRMGYMAGRPPKIEVLQYLGNRIFEEFCEEFDLELDEDEEVDVEDTNWVEFLKELE